MLRSAVVEQMNPTRPASKGTEHSIYTAYMVQYRSMAQRSSGRYPSTFSTIPHFPHRPSCPITQSYRQRHDKRDLRELTSSSYAHRVSLGFEGAVLTYRSFP